MFLKSQLSLMLLGRMLKLVVVLSVRGEVMILGLMKSILEGRYTEQVSDVAVCCVLSGMLYSLAIEPMLNKLRSKINGLFFQSHNVHLQVSAYANDAMNMVNGQQNINHLEKCNLYKSV